MLLKINRNSFLLPTPTSSFPISLSKRYLRAISISILLQNKITNLNLSKIKTNKLKSNCKKIKWEKFTSKSTLNIRTNSKMVWTNMATRASSEKPPPSLSQKPNSRTTLVTTSASSNTAQAFPNLQMHWTLHLQLMSLSRSITCSNSESNQRKTIKTTWSNNEFYLCFITLLKLKL